MTIRNVGLLAVLTTIAFGSCAPAAHADPVTGLLLYSSPDSMILGKVGGGSGLFTPDGYLFGFNDIWTDKNTPISSGQLELDIEGPGHSYWSVVISMPSATAPTVGFFGDASRWPFQDPGAPGLDVSANGRGYNDSSGWFEILDFAEQNGVITRLAVDFYNHGDDYASPRNPWEFGSYRYASEIPLTMIVPVPEPSALPLVGLGLLGLALCQRRTA